MSTDALRSGAAGGRHAAPASGSGGEFRLRVADTARGSVGGLVPSARTVVIALAVVVLVLAVGALVRTPGAPAASAPPPGVVEPVDPVEPDATAGHTPASPAAEPTATGPVSGPVSGPVAGRPSAPALGSETAGWASVLGALSDRRVAALTARDADALDDVYADGAPPLATDEKTVADLQGAGVRPAGLATTVLTAVVVDSGSGGPSRVTLQMVDTRSAYELVDASGGLVSQVPARPASAWRVVLVAEAGEWQIARIDPA